jgi:hypothetical protein
MWHWRHGKQDDGEVRADLDRVARKVEVLYAACEEAGAVMESAAGDAVGGVPLPLIMASRTVCSGAGAPVRVTLAGRQAIAVVTADGPPEPVWAEIRRALACHPPGGGVIRLDYARYPPGLAALAIPGELTVSSALPPAERRAAVRTAVRAARRAGWGGTTVPAFLLPLLAGSSAARKFLTLKGAVTAVTATAVTVGGVTTAAFVNGHLGGGGYDYDPPPVTALHHHHGRALQAPAPAGPALPARRHHHYPVIESAPPVLRPSPSASPVPDGSPSPTSSLSSQSPAPTGTAQPSPSPTAAVPAPAGSPVAGACVIVLGVKVCLGI